MAGLPIPTVRAKPVVGSTIDFARDTIGALMDGWRENGDLFRALGGIDARYELFRDDLDVCWRVWLAGWRVEVVPEAVGYHVAASSRLMRPHGPTRPGDTRYLAERNTLASLLKNYGAARLIWVLPVALLLALIPRA
jgi:GT2 family glycosyltransferase